MAFLVARELCRCSCYTTVLPASSLTRSPHALFVYRTMLLRPRRTKYRKSHKNIRAVLPVVPPEGVTPPPLSFGDYGLYSMESIRLTAAQIEAARMAILKTVGRKGLKLWIRVFPDIPVTKKPLETRMGKGKGSVDHFIANVKAGKMLFEYNCPSLNTARLAFTQAKHKLPIGVKFLQREQLQSGQTTAV